MLDTVILTTESLGDRSYLVHDGAVGIVVDPQRDIDRALAEIEALGVRITHVLETHVHNDYVSGGLALARRTGAAYVLASGEDLAFDHGTVADGDEIRTGSFVVQVLHTPGHTEGHVSYLVGPVDAEPVAVFTGGSLLYGTVGRTDLVAPEQTSDLTRAQYRSARLLAARVPDGAAVYPTHGFGSFCASVAGAEREQSTIAEERRDNVALTIDDEDAFVDRLLAGLTEYPAYYAHMSLLNRAGPLDADLSPPALVDPTELGRRLRAGEWVVDLRQRRAFAADHLVGSLGFELADPFATYLGWLIPWGSRITLIADRAEAVAEAQRQLVRIGIDRPGGAASGLLDEIAPGLERAGYRVADFDQLADERGRRPDVQVVDVRRRDEWDAGHVEGAHSVPLHQILDHVHHVPAGELWVHCASGLRASIAASILARAGHEVVLVDDGFDAAEDAGLVVTTDG